MMICELAKYSYCSAHIQKVQPPMAPTQTSSPPTLNSPSGKHIGELPSQQPPDWWNINGPCTARSRSITAAASGVTTTRSTTLPLPHAPSCLAGGRSQASRVAHARRLARFRTSRELSRP